MFKWFLFFYATAALAGDSVRSVHSCILELSNVEKGNYEVHIQVDARSEVFTLSRKFLNRGPATPDTSLKIASMGSLFSRKPAPIWINPKWMEHCSEMRKLKDANIRTYRHNDDPFAQEDLDPKVEFEKNCKNLNFEQGSLHTHILAKVIEARLKDYTDWQINDRGREALSNDKVAAKDFYYKYRNMLEACDRFSDGKLSSFKSDLEMVLNLPGRKTQDRLPSEGHK